MPTYRVTTWSHVEAPAMVLGRDGQPHYVWHVQRYYDAYAAWVEVNGPDGCHRVDPDGPAILVERTDWEAIGMLVNGLGAKPVQS